MNQECNSNDTHISLPRYNTCFICGKNNPIGLDLHFSYKNGLIITECTLQQEHTGYNNIIHGGILAALLDECMGWSAILSRPILCKSVELTVRYKESVTTNEPLRIWSDLVADKKRLILTKGAIEKSDGTIACTAEGKYFPLPDEEQDRFILDAHWGNALHETFEKIQQARNGRMI